MSNAFADFVSWSSTRPPEPVMASAAARMIRAGTGVTQVLLDVIDAQQPITTVNLCEQTGLESKVIWGLLKNHLKSGRLRHDATQGWNAGVSVRERAAAALLRHAGWTVCPPEGRQE